MTFGKCYIHEKEIDIDRLVTGLVNGLLGGAAGLICVPLIKAAMKEGNKAHAYTVVTVLAASFVSAITYLLAGNLDFNQALPYIIGGVIAAPIGVKLLRKINSTVLSKLFALFLLYCSIRMLIHA